MFSSSNGQPNFKFYPYDSILNINKNKYKEFYNSSIFILNYCDGTGYCK
jgi:hypothetical protein